MTASAPKRAVFLAHRYLGIAVCLLFAVWFVSGIVMMYARMPRLEPRERLAALPTVDLSKVAVEPARALERAALAGPPDRIRLGMLLDRPVYRFQADGGRWATVYADDGSRLSGVSAALAADVVRRHTAATRARRLSTSSEPDQWTLARGLDPYRPLHRFTLDDAAGTEVYVSEKTGEVVLASTRRERALAWAGAIPHWLYITALRRHTGTWRAVVIAAAAVGAAACVLGLAAGVLRYSRARRYRMPSGPSASPYVGAKRWHHWAGLAFGPLALTWVVSGLLSMNPGRWSPSLEPTRAEREVFAGGPVPLSELDQPLAARAASLSTAKEIEIVGFAGEPYLVAWDGAGARAVFSARRDGEARSLFPASDLVTAARRVMGGAAPADVALLTEYDSYYYDRSGARPLPVLRARFADARATWLYVDPVSAEIVRHSERRSRVNRWLYHGLHSFDFPFLYTRRPLWDAVVLFFSLGGTALSLTGVVIGWRRMRQAGRAISAWPASEARPLIPHEVRQ